jgi:hypothetical protein
MCQWVFEDMREKPTKSTLHSSVGWREHKSGIPIGCTDRIELNYQQVVRVGQSLL